MNLTDEPKLAPPGAGIPKFEIFFGGIFIRWRRLCGNREVFNAAFCRERDKIRALIESCDSASGAQRVLISRIRGIEDSSRYWSVWMTVDHLRIANVGMTRVIKSLGKGVVPPDKTSIAALKPSPEATIDVVAEYEKACDDLLEAVASIPNLKTRERYEHPWFGPFDASDWHSMAGGHMGIHRRQIEKILAGLSAQK
jgi:hypothetical protein